MLDSLLRKQGLSEKKISIFMLLSDFGEQPASLIAKRTGLNRSGCYQQLADLMATGFISSIVKNKITYYRANNASSILERLKNDYKKELNQIETLKLMVALKDQQRLTSRPNSLAHFCSGRDAVHHMLKQNLIHSPQPPRVFISANSVQEAYWVESLQFQLQLLDRAQTVSHLITIQNTEFKLSSSAIQKFLSQHLDIGIDMIILNDRVILLSPKEEFGIQIESPTIASATRKIFDIFWKIARK